MPMKIKLKKHGTTIKEKLTGIIFHEYEFDRYGNWVSRKTFENSFLMCRKERDIEYFWFQGNMLKFSTHQILTNPQSAQEKFFIKNLTLWILWQNRIFRVFGFFENNTFVAPLWYTRPLYLGGREYRIHMGEGVWVYCPNIMNKILFTIFRLF